MFDVKREGEGCKEGLWLPYASFTRRYCFFVSPLHASLQLCSPSWSLYLYSDSWCCVADCETNHTLNYSGMCSWAMLWLISFPSLSHSFFSSLLVDSGSLQSATLFQHLVSVSRSLAGSSPLQFNSIQFNLFQFNSIQFNPVQFSSVQFNSIQFSCWLQILWIITWDFTKANYDR